MPAYDFDIARFDEAHHTVLGEGVWGRVYDLGDGTVLKLAKETGGIGSGSAKIDHECAMMAAFEKGNTADLPFALPRLLGRGLVLPGELQKQGYGLWIRSTKLSGRRMEPEELAALPASGQRMIACNLAGVLGAFHGFLGSLDIAKDLKPDGIFALEKENLPLSPEDHMRSRKVFTLLNRILPETLRPVHGDFNITNILFDKDFRVCAIMDFAEMCFGSREDDLCSLTGDLKGFENDLIAAYEDATGQALCPYRLAVAGIKRDFISMLICRYRLGKADEAIENQQRLDDSLARMEREPLIPGVLSR